MYSGFSRRNFTWISSLSGREMSSASIRAIKSPLAWGIQRFSACARPIFFRFRATRILASEAASFLMLRYVSSEEPSSQIRSSHAVRVCILMERTAADNS